MTYRYSTPREALLSYFTGRRGPKAAKQRWQPRGDSSNYGGTAGDEAWLLVGATLHGPTENGGCGIEIGSWEELRIRQWANSDVPENSASWLQRRTVKTLRVKLRELELLPPKRVVVHDEDGNARLKDIEGA